MQRIAIFASGSGSNAREIINHFSNSPEVQVALVVTNRSQAGVLDIAAKHHIETKVVKRAAFESQDFILFLADHKIDFIALAGFLLLIPPSLVTAFENRIVNIHPALLPKYGGAGMYGMNVHRAVKAAGEKQSGMTIHYVNEHYDEGQIIFQAICDLEQTDTAEMIQKKVLQLEHTHYARVVEELLAGDRIAVIG